jgi:hypothetical protein
VAAGTSMGNLGASTVTVLATAATSLY